MNTLVHCTDKLTAGHGMALGHNYELQDCPIARALELIGERWTILVIRDCFLGVSRFNDFLAHLDIPRAILSVRLEKLVAAGILRKKKYGPRQYDYLLTDRGTTLWPMMYSFASWGDEHHAPASGRRRSFSHIACGTDLDERAVCPRCKIFPSPSDVEIRNGPGAEVDLRSDPITKALGTRHQLLVLLTIEPEENATPTTAGRGKKARLARHK